MLEHALMETRPGALLIWHDDVPETAAVLPDYLATARQRGYTFVPLSAFAAGVTGRDRRRGYLMAVGARASP